MRSIISLYNNIEPDRKASEETEPFFMQKKRRSRNFFPLPLVISLFNFLLENLDVIVPALDC